MPLPLLVPVFLGGAAVISGLVGVKKGADGVGAMKRAQKVGTNAERRHQRAVAELERAREGTKGVFEQLAADKQRIHRTTLRRLIEFLERFDHEARVQALQQLEFVGVTREEVKQFAVAYLETGGTLSGALTAVATGAGAASATTALVGTFATASTGAAISGLSGAAAESAVLAWIGGGAVAAGGGGVAVGSAILGGVAVAPALLVGGFVLAAQGEKVLTKAERFAAEAEKRVEQLATVVALLRRVDDRVRELRDVTARLDRRAASAVDALWAVADSFDPDREQHVRLFGAAMQLAKALAGLLRVPVLSAGGDINPQLEAALVGARALLT